MILWPSVKGLGIQAAVHFFLRWMPFKDQMMSQRELDQQQSRHDRAADIQFDLREESEGGLESYFVLLQLPCCCCDGA